MSNFIKFTPLLGSRSGGSGSCDGSGGGPLCYLLEIDEAKLLLDCGWSDGFDVEELQLLKR